MLRGSTLGLLLFVVVGALPVRASAEDVKLAYVDLSRAMGETDDGRKAKANLKKVFEQKQKELDEQQEDLKKSIEDLDKKRTLLPADKVREREVELQQRMQKVQQTYTRHQQDLAAKEQEATGRIAERMTRILQKIAITENLTMVLDRQQGGVVFGKPHLDLTNELIRRYNAGEGAAAGTANSVGATTATPGDAAKPAGAKK